MLAMIACLISESISLTWFIFFLLLGIPSTLPLSSAVEFSDKLNEVVDFVIAHREYAPSTIRITIIPQDNPGSNNILINRIQTIPAVIETLNQSVAYWHLHERKHKSVKRYDLYTFIHLVQMETEDSFLDIFHSKILPSVDPRRDFLVIIPTEGNLITPKVVKDVAVLKIRNKLVLEGFGNYGKISPAL